MLLSGNEKTPSALCRGVIRSVCQRHQGRAASGRGGPLGPLLRAAGEAMDRVHVGRRLTDARAACQWSGSRTRKRRSRGPGAPPAADQKAPQPIVCAAAVREDQAAEDRRRYPEAQHRDKRLVIDRQRCAERQVSMWTALEYREFAPGGNAGRPPEVSGADRRQRRASARGQGPTGARARPVRPDPDDMPPARGGGETRGQAAADRPSG